ncbi:carboxylating nicotinate-nucleotide diphosphorylase [Phyllobacterium sp. 0TCS1.6C]|uniref:carboxylating nicotinate-nucleotide diphosphorylase n=1 Tax=unclassified Phyllobacterium TaxID=2638441 RepID=UPI0022641ED6|nr:MULTISPECIES: carboxylating nicotinate-nucleotide diphosphorylase [unclassified Phyllobacterium]MCX8280546.1 carboxylating nicotinate-nucleotide diphosphorylase [Phyllobacterium sp. 0TCS1.6C]MCX8295005.1 carboxylating nicotinate-nucleotide diphosphorylase [Phyllobacterium sp. 0TCS1.6A]
MMSANAQKQVAAHRPSLPQILIVDAVRAALLEDLGRAGDLTTNATLPEEARARAVLSSREDGVICGVDFARAAFAAIDRAISFQAIVGDGERVSPGQHVATVEGNARAILSAERVGLNFLMHLSGIATHTARFAALIAHTKARVCDTRKTIPGMRAFAKYAVKCGGGSNHRFGLDDAILIKDNHIAVAGGVAKAILAARAYAGHLVKIEVEVDGLEQMQQALDVGADVILLDNMGPELLEKAVEINAGRAKLEASGRIDFETIKAVAETGVDYISTSKITMAAPTLDIGLDIELR